MVGIDNSVKVAKLISDLNAKILNLKNANANIQEQLNDSWDRESDYQKRLDEACRKNKELEAQLSDEKFMTDKHVEFNKQLLKDLDKACYERDQNRQLADNYAAEAYEWQQKYYHEKDKHEKATKKITSLKKELKRYPKGPVLKFNSSQDCHCTIHPYTPKHARSINTLTWDDDELNFDKDATDRLKERILDRCDFIDSEIHAWWHGRISDEEFSEAVEESLDDIYCKAYDLSKYERSIIISLCEAASAGAYRAVYESDHVLDNVTEAVKKIKQTVKEAE